MENVINKIAELANIKNITKGIRTVFITTGYPKCGHFHLEEGFYIPLEKECKANNIIWDIDVDPKKEEYIILLRNK